MHKDPAVRSSYWMEYKARKGDEIRAHQNARNAAMSKEERSKRNAEAHRRNAEKRCAYSKMYAEKYKAERKVKRQAWAQTPEGKIAVCHASHVRRARLRGVVCTATRKDVRNFLFAATECFYCQEPFTDQLRATLDHFVPISKDGPHSVENFRAACFTCNTRKQAQDAEVFVRRRHAPAS